MSDLLRESLAISLKKQTSMLSEGRENNELLTEDERGVISVLAEHGFFEDMIRGVGDLNRHMISKGILHTQPIPVSEVARMSRKFEILVTEGKLNGKLQEVTADTTLTENIGGGLGETPEGCAVFGEGLGNPELHTGQDDEGMYGVGSASDKKAPKGKADKGQGQQAPAADASKTDNSGYMSETELEEENARLQAEISQLVSEGVPSEEKLEEENAELQKQVVALVSEKGTSKIDADALINEFESGTFDFAEMEVKKGKKVPKYMAHEDDDTEDVKEHSDTPDGDTPDYSKEGTAAVPGGDTSKAAEPGPGTQSGSPKPTKSDPGPGNTGKAKSKADQGHIGKTGLSQNEQTIVDILKSKGIEEGSQDWYRSYYAGIDAIEKGS